MPNENGDNKNELELVALGYSDQQQEDGCLGNTAQFLVCFFFLPFKFQGLVYID